MAQKVKGLDKLLKRLTSIEDKMKSNEVLEKACQMVEDDAKINCPVGSGELRRSITHYVEDGVGYVGTNLYYAPYVEYGTGIYSSQGNGREGYWVFVEGSDGSMKSETRKTYTLEEVKRIMAILRSKGLNAFYTNGQRPQPFLQPAYEQNRQKIDKMLDDYIEEVLRNA